MLRPARLRRGGHDDFDIGEAGSLRDAPVDGFCSRPGRDGGGVHLEVSQGHVKVLVGAAFPLVGVIAVYERLGAEGRVCHQRGRVDGVSDQKSVDQEVYRGRDQVGPRADVDVCRQGGYRVGCSVLRCAIGKTGEVSKKKKSVKSYIKNVKNVNLKDGEGEQGGPPGRLGERNKNLGRYYE